MVKQMTYWKAAGSDSGSYATGTTDTHSTWVAYKDGTFTGTEKFHPLINGSANANSWVRIDADATTAKVATFDNGNTDTPSTDTAITSTAQTARAGAQVNLWYNSWMGTALDEGWLLVGKDDGQNMFIEKSATGSGTGCTQAMIDNSNENGCTTVAEGTDTWKTRTIGAAEVTQTSKVNLLAAAGKEKAAAERWEVAVTAEAAAAAEDLTRGQELLADLVDEIAPIARMEISARNALAEAIEAQLQRTVAAEELGDEFVAAVGSTPATDATGVRAVRDAANAARDSVAAQQAFHNERVEWALDNLTPVKTAWENATGMKSMLDDAVTEAEDRYDNARKQCKRAAFEDAQKAREQA